MWGKGREREGTVLANNLPVLSSCSTACEPTVLSVPHKHWMMQVFRSNSTTRSPSDALSFFNGSVFDHRTAHLEWASRSIPEDGRCKRRSFRMIYAESVALYINGIVL